MGTDGRGYFQWRCVTPAFRTRGGPQNEEEAETRAVDGARVCCSVHPWNRQRSYHVGDAHLAMKEMFGVGVAFRTGSPVTGLMSTCPILLLSCLLQEVYLEISREKSAGISGGLEQYPH